MPEKMKKKNLSILNKFLKQYPKTEEMEILIADIHGVLRGKRIRSDEFKSIFRDGFTMPGGTVLLDILGDAVPGISWSGDDGDPDTDAEVIASSLAPVPWSKKPRAQTLFTFRDRKNKPFFAEPRNVLENIVKKVKNTAPKIVMAVELEFYLLDGNTDRPTPKISLIPGVGRPQPGPQVYHPDDLWDIENFLDDLHQNCQLQNIPAGTTISEFAPAQFEINLHHVNDPLLACDHAVLLKRVIKATARQHGFVACFMAKPFEEESGSGMHIHMSAYDKKNKNIFSDNKEANASPPFSDKLKYAVGGLKKLMSESTAIFAPNINSFRRLRPDMFAPVEPNWGVNHRNVSIRIPVSNAKNLRFEHRVAGADANPYIVTAAILAGLDYGIKNKCKPGKMIKEGEIITLQQKIPNRWNKAIDAFEKSKILPEYLGHEFSQSFIVNRRYEESELNNKISNVDFEWYLRSV
jgi:glutamine synthetase